jgi:DNA-binding XRE family transcriptional regulator
LHDVHRRDLMQAEMNHLVSAVRELRKALGDSQQAFATRLGMSVRAIANYETDRAPTGRALYKLEQLARANGRYELACQFARALATEMEWAQEPRQSVWAGVVREIVRNERLCDGWSELAKALARELEKLIAKAKSGMQIESPLKSQDAAIANLESWLTEARHAVEGSAEKTVERLAQEWLKENRGKTIEQARAAIWIQRPELYSQYQQERADASRGTRFEESLAVYGTKQHAERQKARKGKKS